MLYLSSESAHHYCKLTYFSSHWILGIIETRIDFVKWDFGRIAWSVFHFKLGKMNTFYLCIGLLTVKILVKNVQTRRSWVDVSSDGRQCLVISCLCSSSLGSWKSILSLSSLFFPELMRWLFHYSFFIISSDFIFDI